MTNNKIVTIAELEAMIEYAKDYRVIHHTNLEVYEKWKADKLAMLEEIDKILDKHCYTYDGEQDDGSPKMYKILAGDKDYSWIPYEILKELKQSLGGGQ